MQKIQELSDFIKTVDKISWLVMSEFDKNKFRIWNTMTFTPMNERQKLEFDILTEKLYSKMLYVKQKLEHSNDNNSKSVLNLFGLNKSVRI